jgi:hypothetical protein
MRPIVTPAARLSVIGVRAGRSREDLWLAIRYRPRRLGLGRRSANGHGRGNLGRDVRHLQASGPSSNDRRLPYPPRDRVRDRTGEAIKSSDDYHVELPPWPDFKSGCVPRTPRRFRAKNRRVAANLLETATPLSYSSSDASEVWFLSFAVAAIDGMP